MARKTTNYLNNKDLLIQIHKSKYTFCEFENPDYSDFDEIIYDLDVLNNDDICTEYHGEWDIVYVDPTRMKKVILSRTLVSPKTVTEFIQDVKEKKLKKMKKVDPTLELVVEDILIGDLVFRLMTFDHIPEDPNWDDEIKIRKKKSDGHMKVNFPPFQHFILENGMPILVGQSHYKNKEFSSNHGRISNELGKMFMLLVEKISKKGNWRNYTYLEDMKGDALRQLSQVGLQFDEGRGQIPNPFAFYTTVVNNSFKRVLNIEKKVRNIRDDLIEIAGETPSFTRQLETETKATEEQQIIDATLAEAATAAAVLRPPNINTKYARGKRK